MFLPDELFIEILLRLPVKSLLRFKSVSKSWLSLISKPHFARLHFDLAAARNDKLLIIDPSAPETETTSVDLDASLHDDSAFTTIKTSFRLPKYSYNGQIMGSCRGFLLVWDQHLRSGLYLWNPSTSVHKQLPRSPILSPYLYGFGYDPSTDDYLVVLADYRTDEVWGSQFVLFSLRANSWERIEDTCLPYITNCDEATSGSLLNGALHWLVKSCDVDVDGDVIFAFDLVERSFSEIPLPHYNDDDFFYSHLWVHGGLLSLCVGHVNDAAEIWVMEEYKVHSSWTKSIVLDTPDVYFLPIYSTKSGDIIGKGGMTRLVKCNAKGELLEDRLYPLRSDLEEALITYIDAGIHEYIRLRAAVYTETLHSLPGDDSGQEEDE